MARCSRTLRPICGIATPTNSTARRSRSCASGCGRRVGTNRTGISDASELLADLRVVAESLRAQGERHVLGGDLHDVIRHVETFGFHLAAMDIRDHASRHAATMAELFRHVGYRRGLWRTLPEAQKCALLEREINDPRPIIPRLTDRVQAVTQEVIATFLLIRDQIREGDPAALGTYVISARRDAIRRARGTAPDEGVRSGRGRRRRGR